ncbi:ATP-binding protein [Planctomycetota bacterium]
MFDNMHAIVYQIRKDGMILVAVDPFFRDQKVWLPAEEWSDHPKEWETVAYYQLTEGIDAFDVKYIQPIGGPGGIPIVSRKQFTSDHLDDSWMGQPRLMVVTELTKTLVRGKIGNVEAVFKRGEYERFLDEANLTRELHNHGAIGKGDLIWGIVTELWGEYADVELDPVQYLMALQDQIARENEHSSQPSIQSAATREPSLPADLSDEAKVKIRYTLLVENDPSVRRSIADRLRNWGLKVDAVESLEQAERVIRMLMLGSEQSERETAICEDGANLAIIDPNLNPANSDLRGMILIEQLSQDTRWRILLVTGEAEDKQKLKKYSDIRVHGFEHKPLISIQLVEAIEACVAMTKAVPLRVFVEGESRNIGAIGSTRSGAPGIVQGGEIVEHPKSQVTGLLQHLVNDKPGTTAYLFAVHERSFRTHVVAHAGLELKWYQFRGKIRKSRICDVAFGSDTIVESIHEGHPLHFWTEEMIKYRSFCGIPIEVPGCFRHVLVAFHPDANAFNDNWVSTARLYAERSGCLLRTYQLLRERVQEAAIVASGLALECLAHELCNDLTDLNFDIDNIHDLLTANCKQSQNGETDSIKALLNYREEMLDTIMKVKLLRGVRSDRSYVPVQPTVRQAGFSCRRVAADIVGRDIERMVRIDVLEQPWGDEWYVRAVPATVLVVVFNLYINAVQQLRLMSGIRNQGRVWPTIRLTSDSKNRPWGIIQIHDTGPGIHPEDWTRVFQPGYTTKPGGTGLGLYICRHLLDNVSQGDRQATLDVSQSTLWTGTTVTIRLPLVTMEDIKSDDKER